MTDIFITYKQRMIPQMGTFFNEAHTPAEFELAGLKVTHMTPVCEVKDHFQAK